MNELLAAGAVGATLVGLAVAVAVVGAFLFVLAPTRRRAVEFLRENEAPERRTSWRDAIERSALGRAVEADLRSAGMTAGSSSFLGSLAAIAIVGFAVLPALFGTGVGVLLALAATAAPYVVVRRRAGRHRKEFARQLPTVLDLIASALRAGQSEVQAFEMVAQEMTGAAAEEFGETQKAIALGASVESATQSLLERLPSADVEMVVDAIQLSHRVGGNLAQMLADIATIIRDRTRLEGEIRALTAQGRASVYLVTALAPVGLLAINLINPAWGQLLFTTPLGWIVLATVAILELVGFLTARAAAAVEV